MEYLDTTIMVRLTAAFLAGLLVGLERQIRMKPIGFGTFTLVASGSCAFMLITETLVFSGQNIPIAVGVVTGIGFLGAGALIKEGPSVMGFTTASAIWLIGATGVAFGAGHYLLGVATTLQCLLVFLIDYIFEKRGFGGHSKKLTISFEKKPSEKDLMEMLNRFRPMVESFEVCQEPVAFTYVFRVKINLQDIEELGSIFGSFEDVIRFQIE